MEFLRLAEEAVANVNVAFEAARAAVHQRLAVSGRHWSEAMEREQHTTHSLAWMKIYALASEELLKSALSAVERGEYHETFDDITRIGLGECVNQFFHGIAMSQSETARICELLPNSTSYRTREIETIVSDGNTPGRRARVARAVTAADHRAASGDEYLDETIQAMRRQLRDFVDARVRPYAHRWHLENAYIPIELIDELGELGVFALTIPEQYGGMGLGKIAMCVVTEELSRGYIGVGSLGTRAEIAAELLLEGGTSNQKDAYLHRIANGKLLTAAVFTEPSFGSDLAHLKTRATKRGDSYALHGSKTWITHAERADLMIVLARTGALDSGHAGLSLFLVEKPRGAGNDPFPVQGIFGSEIPVLGYRGMKEFEISFDELKIPASALLGNQEGLGFKQLMRTFESARIQTAARSVGVAQSALEHAIAYAHQRIQFGRAIIEFPRVADKIAAIAVDIHIARLLTWAAAKRKDLGYRCDLEAGASKLYAARCAWAAADSALQIHGGAGFAMESPISRLLCDARILSIFEGTSEIQAQVMARRLLQK
jgi:(2S)-methylsuccinyl-CoA dehydrogenase